MLIDTHCHLNHFSQNAELVIHEALNHGIKHLLIPATQIHEFKQLRQLQKIHPEFWYAFGIHPLFPPSDPDSALLILEKELQQAPTHAIGEIGLDFYNKNQSEQDIILQKKIFNEQLILAKKYQLPIILHARKSLSFCLENIKKHQIRSGFAHAFSGSIEEAQLFIRQGFKIGIGVALLRANATKLRTLVTTLPVDSYVLETDAPYMMPNHSNTPDNLLKVAKKVAEIRNISLQQVAQESYDNALQILENR